MTKARDVRCYDYVNRPYGEVRDALKSSAAKIFHEATQAASSRAESVAAELHVKLGEISLGAEIAISVNSIEERERQVSAPEATILHIQWEAAKSPRLFPLMKGELSVYPLTGKETQLDFFGHYEPPLGILGSAIDALAGHRIAEATVDHFLKDIGRYLREKLPKQTSPGA